MSNLIERCLCDGMIKLHRDRPLTILGKLSAKGYFNESYKTSLIPIDCALKAVGVAFTEITTLRKGVVRVKGRLWFALSNSNMTIYPGHQIRVIDWQNHTLLVEQYQCGFEGRHD